MAAIIMYWIDPTNTEWTSMGRPPLSPVPPAEGFGRSPFGATFGQ